MPDDPQKILSMTAITRADLVRALSAASGRTITEAQIQAIAEEGDLLTANGTLSLLKYTAYLAKMESQHE